MNWKAPAPETRNLSDHLAHEILRLQLRQPVARIGRRQPGVLLSHLVSAAAAGVAAFHLGDLRKWRVAL